MKLKMAMYKVTVGFNDPENCVTDNMLSKTVTATDALSAMKKVRLAKNEYYSNVELIVRADK